MIHLFGYNMKHITKLAIAFCLLSAKSYATYGIEECLLKGWMNSKPKVPFTLRILYKDDNSNRISSKVASLTITIDGQKTIFPTDAFDGLGSWLGTPSGVGASGRKGEYHIYFLNCGDAAKSFSLHFTIRDGVLRERQIMPKPYTEVKDTIRIYDKDGKIVYDGPCDRQGKPIRR
jgi:hypothetical protein